ncbi:MAG: tRNA lysidine(34) synthetase TilS [Deltaproteobacteria bacterium]|nr:tRNA lysidine(34) synthetase TilS [Deltaproteobacteria bacterium]
MKRIRHIKLFKVVEQTIGTHQMFKPQDAVLVGVSGGPDSVTLLHVLAALAPRLSLRLGVAHLNHGLRPQTADTDAEFVSSLAKEMALPLFLEKADVQKYRKENRLSLEEAARHVRYAFFYRTAQQNRFNKIALGHHADDNAELVLMNLMRGSGPLGMSGIPPVREEQIARTLIQLKKQEILDFLNAERLPYVSDPSNREARHLRNRIRHHLIPVLKTSYNPGIVETLNRMSSILRDETDWIEEIVGSDLKKSILEEQDEAVAVSVKQLKRMHIAAQRRVFRKVVSRVKGDLKSVTFSHINSVIGLLKSESTGKRLDLPGRVSVRRKGDALLFSKEKRALRDIDPNAGNQGVRPYEYEIEVPGSVYIKEITAHMAVSQIGPEDVSPFPDIGPDTGFLDMDALRFPLVVRNFRPGDRFTPMGMTGSQKVKKYFTNNKVPAAQRSKCPVLLSRNKIVWVVGHRIDESVKIKPSTQNILKAELLLA